MHSLPRLLVSLLLSILSLNGCASIVTGDWEEARKQNSISAYKTFLRKHPESDFTYEAKTKIETLAWLKAKEEDTIDSYENFIKIYSPNPRIDEANENIMRLTWHQTEEEGSIRSYSEFLKTYPESRYGAEAKHAIVTLKKAAEKSAYLSINRARRIEPLIEFLAQYPDSEYRTPIEHRLAKFPSTTLTNPKIFPYKQFHIGDPVTGTNAVKRNPGLMMNFAGRTTDETIAPKIIIVKGKTKLSGFADLDLVPGKLLLKPLGKSGGNQLLKVKPMDKKGFVMLNFYVIIPVGTVAHVPKNQWILWGDMAIRGSKVRFTNKGLELTSGTRYVNTKL